MKIPFFLTELTHWPKCLCSSLTWQIWLSKKSKLCPFSCSIVYEHLEDTFQSWRFTVWSLSLCPSRSLFLHCVKHIVFFFCWCCWNLSLKLKQLWAITEVQGYIVVTLTETLSHCLSVFQSFFFDILYLNTSEIPEQDWRRYLDLRSVGPLDSCRGLNLCVCYSLSGFVMWLRDGSLLSYSVRQFELCKQTKC